MYNSQPSLSEREESMLSLCLNLDREEYTDQDGLNLTVNCNVDMAIP
jgi:hypothetical protein